MEKYDVNKPDEWPENKCFICGKKINRLKLEPYARTRDKKSICMDDINKLFGQTVATRIMGVKIKASKEILNHTSKEIYIDLNKSDTAKSNEKKGILCCPLCGSTDLQAVGGNDRKDFSLSKAVGGAILAGGIGALAGFAGEGSDKVKLVCMNCGLKFEK
ncbi:hypothetical protein QUW45_02500 [Limosilactobacillus pontis]|uniref:hypothetical protein n=1 Tax=Limosilactobacillus pontis TaxID=35787 RepID=UPI0025A3E98C|nr:hypothetical protein [Limosilactobacillus pontis]MDM8331561.1 hypothetical protein [Limosilactobacillus pontis]